MKSTTSKPTQAQARELQALVKRQHQARERLMSAANPDTVRDAAREYLDATDACYEAAMQVERETVFACRR